MPARKFQYKYRIKSTRLKYWDYSNPGLYFVTICTKDIIPWFGKVKGGKMVLYNIGNIAQDLWLEIDKHFNFVRFFVARSRSF